MFTKIEAGEGDSDPAAGTHYDDFQRSGQESRHPLAGYRGKRPAALVFLTAGPIRSTCAKTLDRRSAGAERARMNHRTPGRRLDRMRSRGQKSLCGRGVDSGYDGEIFARGGDAVGGLVGGRPRKPKRRSGRGALSPTDAEGRRTRSRAGCLPMPRKFSAHKSRPRPEMPEMIHRRRSVIGGAKGGEVTSCVRRRCPRRAAPFTRTTQCRWTQGILLEDDVTSNWKRLRRRAWGDRSLRERPRPLGLRQHVKSSFRSGSSSACGQLRRYYPRYFILFF